MVECYSSPAVKTIETQGSHWGLPQRRLQLTSHFKRVTQHKLTAPSPYPLPPGERIKID
ncbi:MAG: hypothetical protein Tsb002_21900 [Wenzhouxiangellaceae bacterium]